LPARPQRIADLEVAFGRASGAPGTAVQDFERRSGSTGGSTRGIWQKIFETAAGSLVLAGLRNHCRIKLLLQLAEA
jgi:hypothetical protein